MTMIWIALTMFMGSCGLFRGLFIGCPESIGVIEAVHEQDMRRLEIREQELRAEATRLSEENATEQQKAILQATTEAFKIEARATAEFVEAEQQAITDRIAEQERTARQRIEEQNMTERLYKEQMEKTERHRALMVTTFLLALLFVLWRFSGALLAAILEFYRMLFGYRIIEQYGPAALNEVQYPALTGNEGIVPYDHFMRGVRNRRLQDDEWDVVEDPETGATYGIILHPNTNEEPSMYRLTDDLRGRHYG